MAKRIGVPWVIVCVLLSACGGGGSQPDAEMAPDAVVEHDAAPADAATGNATLSALTASVGVFDPPFEPEVTDYHLDLVLAEGDVAFTPIAAAPDGIAITVDGAAASSGVASPSLVLSPGDRDVDIVVVADGGATVTYHVHVHRGVDALASLAPSLGSLSPAFDLATDSYTLGLGTTTAAVAVTPTLLFPGRATVTVNGGAVASGTASPALAVAMGQNPLTVAVTPATRPARSTVISALRGADALADIRLSYLGGALPDRLSPAFVGTTTSYAADVGLWVQALQVTVTTTYPGATVTVAGGAAATGTPSAPVALGLGPTSIPIIVAAGDGTQRTYTLAVTRGSQVLQQAYAKASNTDEADSFGWSVAVWGDTLAVGAPYEDSGATGVGGNQGNDSTRNHGAVYVFTRTGGTWSQQAYLKASTHVLDGDHFGRTVALWGDTLVVGAPDEDSAATGVGGNQAGAGADGAGAVYVFTRSGTTWSQQAYVKASNTGSYVPSDRFGISVALWGDTLAVGADQEDSAATGIGGNQVIQYPSNYAANSGAVYVFTRTGVTWSQQAYVKASNTQTMNLFGSSVALWGDTLAVGALAEGTPLGSRSGAVYVFARAGTTWSQQAFLKAAVTGWGDEFGTSLALGADTLAVGAPGEDSDAVGVNGDPSNDNVVDSGAAYVFTRAGTTWSQQAFIKASTIAWAPNHFGWSIALWGDTLAVGCPYDDSAATGIGGNEMGFTYEAGAAHVFKRAGATWSQQAYVKASNTDAGDSFGQAVALWGDTLAVSAQGESSAAVGVGGDQADDTLSGAGAVYTFR